MPQFDFLIIFPLIKDFIIIFFLFFFTFINIMFENLNIIKFRIKVLKFIRLTPKIVSMIELLFLRTKL